MEIVLEVIEDLGKHNKPRYFENILKSCITTYNWSEQRTRSALTNATQQGFVIEITFKGINTYRIPPHSRVPPPEKIIDKGRITKYDGNGKTDIETIVEMIEELEKSSKGQYFDNIFRACKTRYNWSETRTRIALITAI